MEEPRKEKRKFRRSGTIFALDSWKTPSSVKEVPHTKFVEDLTRKFRRSGTIFTLDSWETSSSVQISGGDALRGNTRTHPEHEG